jgi:hypothetical protein
MRWPVEVILDMLGSGMTIDLIMNKVKPDNKSESKRLGSCDFILTHNEFKVGIKKAEEGPFHSVQQSMQNFELWIKNKEKK